MRVHARQQEKIYATDLRVCAASKYAHLDSEEERAAGQAGKSRARKAVCQLTPTITCAWRRTSIPDICIVFPRRCQDRSGISYSSMRRYQPRFLCHLNENLSCVFAIWLRSSRQVEHAPCTCISIYPLTGSPHTLVKDD